MFQFSYELGPLIAWWLAATVDSKLAIAEKNSRICFIAVHFLRLVLIYLNVAHFTAFVELRGERYSIFSIAKAPIEKPQCNATTIYPPTMRILFSAITFRYFIYPIFLLRIAKS